MTRTVGRRVSAVLVAVLVVTSGLVAFAGTAGAQSSAKADIVFVFDTSGSMGGPRDALAANIESFANDLESKGVDARYALVGYDYLPSLEQDFTSDQTVIKSEIESLSLPGGTERASDAILFAFDNLAFRSDAKTVIVVVTDEDDDSTSTTRQAAIQRVLDEDALLVSLAPSQYGWNTDDDLKTMAESAGGEWVDIGLPDFQTVIDTIAGAITDAVGSGPEPGRNFARFEVVDTAVNRTTVAVGEPVEVTATVRNDGGREGKYTALLSASLERVDSQRYAIDADAERTFRFVVSFDEPGRYDLFVRTKFIDTLTVTPPREPSANVTLDASGNRTVIAVRDARAGEPIIAFVPPSNRALTEGVTIDSIEINTTSSGSFDISVESIPTVTPPTNVTLPSGSEGVVYYDIDATRPDDIESVTYTYTVEKALLAGLGTDGDAVLYRLTGTPPAWETPDVTVVNETADTITFRATFTGFSIHAVGVERPVIRIEDASLRTPSITAGDDVRVLATVRNVGGATGNYTVGLQIDGRTLVSKTVVVPGEDERQVSLRAVVDEAGDYTVSLGGGENSPDAETVAVGNLSVAAATTPTPDDTADDGTTDAPTTVTTSEEPAADSGPTTGGADAETTAGSGPGFTAVLAVLALLALAGVAARRTN